MTKRVMPRQHNAHVKAMLQCKIAQASERMARACVAGEQKFQRIERAKLDAARARLEAES